MQTHPTEKRRASFDPSLLGAVEDKASRSNVIPQTELSSYGGVLRVRPANELRLMVDSPSNHQFALGLRSDETPTNVRSDEKAKLRKKFFQSKAVLEIDSAYRKRHSVQLRITRADPLSSPRSNTVYNMR
mmetsp:Transcript_27091/g.31254  ORF Transcript_27091/g.31254 Transcript_27091/m.31254 type:complete len:130 (-) Transcript_27091:206-595(-)